MWHPNIIESVLESLGGCFKVKTIRVNYDFLTLFSQPSLSEKHLKFSRYIMY